MIKLYAYIIKFAVTRKRGWPARLVLAGTMEKLEDAVKIASNVCG